MTKEDVQEMIDEGLTQRQIAQSLDLSQTATRYWLKKFGLQTIRSGEKKRD